MFTRLVSIIAVIVVIAATASATRVLSEDFVYPVGDNLTAHGWTAHSGVGTGPVKVVSTNSDVGNSLNTSISGFPTPGGAHVEITEVTPAAEDVNKSHSALCTADGQTAYFSMLVKVTLQPTGVSGNYFAHFLQTGSTTVFEGKVFVRPSGAGFNFGASANQNATTGAVFETTVRNLNQTYLIVLKYTVVNGAANDTVDLFVDPADLSTEPGTADIHVVAGTDVSVAGLGALALRQSLSGGFGMGTIQIDACRVADTYAEATVPVVVSAYGVE